MTVLPPFCLGPKAIKIEPETIFHRVTYGGFGLYWNPKFIPAQYILPPFLIDGLDIQEDSVINYA
jgi:hypothetical protein